MTTQDDFIEHHISNLERPTWKARNNNPTKQLKVYMGQKHFDRSRYSHQKEVQRTVLIPVNSMVNQIKCTKE